MSRSMASKILHYVVVIGYLRIPMIAASRSDGSRPPDPIDCDQWVGADAVRCICNLSLAVSRQAGERPSPESRGGTRARCAVPSRLTKRRAREVPVDPRGRLASRGG